MEMCFSFPLFRLMVPLFPYICRILFVSPKFSVSQSCPLMNILNVAEFTWKSLFRKLNWRMSPCSCVSTSRNLMKIQLNFKENWWFEYLRFFSPTKLIYRMNILQTFEFWLWKLKNVENMYNIKNRDKFMKSPWFKAQYHVSPHSFSSTNKSKWEFWFQRLLPTEYIKLTLRKIV